MQKFLFNLLLALALSGGLLFIPCSAAQAADGRLVYLVSDLRIPFWDIMWRGIRQRAQDLDYTIEVHSAENDAKRELQHTVAAIRAGVDGIVLSPTNSSAAVTVLKLAGQAGIPVVIADIGAESEDYVSYIASDNFAGSYDLGRILVDALQDKGWTDGSVGIIAIPQKRANGQARTAGFIKALKEQGVKGNDIFQQVDFSYQETRDFARRLIDENDDLRAIWLQGSDRYRGALDALHESGKQDQVLLICFDAEPEFLELIPQGVLVGAGMQQPFLMGEQAVTQLVDHLQGKTVAREVLSPVLAISAKNIDDNMRRIRRNVLGLKPD
jgi:ribose transport system substrate-binding protein